MILRFGGFCQLNEMVKNERRAQALADEICRKVEEVCTLCSTEIEMGDVSMLVVISNVDEQYMSKINSILSSMKPKMEKQDLVLSWYENTAAPARKSPQIVAHIKSVHTIRVKPPRYIYHYTNADINSILRKGLVPISSSFSDKWRKNSALEYPAAIFAIADDETLWGGSNLLEIDTQGLKNKWWKDLNFTGGPAIMTFEPIPADHIRVISESERKTRSDAKKADAASKRTTERASDVKFAEEIKKGTASFEGKDPVNASFEVISAIASGGGKEALDWYFSCERTGKQAQSMANMAAAAGNNVVEELVYSMFPDVSRDKAEKWASMSNRNRNVLK